MSGIPAGDRGPGAGAISAARSPAGDLARAAAGPALAGIAAFALARGVLLPSQGFWDTGEFQVVPPVLGTAHPTGYPSYVILGWLASLALTPAGEPALRMNLLSAFLLAATAALTVVVVRQLGGRTGLALAAGLLLALTPISWRMGTFADPHTLHLALAGGLLVLLVAWERRRRSGTPTADRWLVAAAALYGVMLGNQALTILLAPGIALYVLAVEPRIVARPGFVARCAAALLATTVAVYLELPIRAAMGAPIVYGTPSTWDGFWYVVLAEQFRGDLVDPFGELGRKLGELVELGAEQLGVLVAAVPAAFVLVAVRLPRFALLTTAWLVATCWFAASYTNAAIDRYYLVPLLVVAAWLGVGAGLLLDAVAGTGAIAGPSRGEGTAAGARHLVGVIGLVLAGGLLLPAVLAAPETRLEVDQSGDRRAETWSRWVLETTLPDAVIVSWWSFSTPLWYRTVLFAERPDVSVVDDRDRLDENLGSVEDVIRANVATRPVYLVRNLPEIEALEAAWVIEVIPDPGGVQPLYRVVGPRPAGLARGTSAIVQRVPARMGP